MKQHKGMRPQDIVILLKIATLKDKQWLAKDLAVELNISASEVSESLNRSKLATLLSADKKMLMKSNLIDFLQYGLRYAFPAEPGPIQRGMLTAQSAPPLNKEIQSKEYFVWPYAKGDHRGQLVEPLYPNVPQACKIDSRLYELLALVDALRVGRVREQKIAIEELKKRIL